VSFINPYAANLGGGFDPFFSSVVQLAHFDGSNGGTSPFPNSCPRGNTITSSTGAVLSTTQVKFGTTSVRIGSSLQNVKAASHADYGFGAGDWCIEWWQRLDSLTLDFNAAKVFFDMRPSALTNGVYPTIYSDNAAGNLNVSVNGTVRIAAPNGSLTAAVFQLITVAKVSGTLRAFVSGTQVGSSFTDSLTYVASGFFLGSAGNGGAGSLGYYDDLRITNGAGRYSGNFTPDATPFPNL